jgi:hypothetical protein
MQQQYQLTTWGLKTRFKGMKGDAIHIMDESRTNAGRQNRRAERSHHFLQ